MQHDPKQMDILEGAYCGAMWAWADIESRLFGVFLAAHNGNADSYEYLQATYFAAVSFDLRLKMTHRVSKIRWGKKKNYIGEWNEIHRECQTQDGKRGRIAHLVGSTFFDDKDLSTTSVLTVPSFHPKYPKTPAIAKVEGIGWEKLEALRSNWVGLGMRIHKFTYFVSQKP